MRVFVSGQLKDQRRVREAQQALTLAGMILTHDWTGTEELGGALADPDEAGRRAALDIKGVISADIYVLMTTNEQVGKGMYAELGAALALRETTGSPQVFIVGPMKHPSVFYMHPATTRVSSIDEVLAWASMQPGKDQRKVLPPKSLAAAPTLSFSSTHPHDDLPREDEARRRVADRAGRQSGRLEYRLQRRLSTQSEILQWALGVLLLAKGIASLDESDACHFAFASDNRESSLLEVISRGDHIFSGIGAVPGGWARDARSLIICHFPDEELRLTLSGD